MSCTCGRRYGYEDCPSTGCPMRPHLLPATEYGRHQFIPSNPTGWTCPKCDAVNGPHVDQCPCSAKVPTAISISPTTEWNAS